MKDKIMIMGRDLMNEYCELLATEDATTNKHPPTWSKSGVIALIDELATRILEQLGGVNIDQIIDMMYSMMQDPQPGTTYGDTVFENPAVVYGYNEALIDVKYALKKLPIPLKEEECPNCKEVLPECACMRNKCVECGKSVGNITFTVCYDCWNNGNPKTSVKEEPKDLRAEPQVSEKQMIEEFYDALGDKLSYYQGADGGSHVDLAKLSHAAKDCCIKWMQQHKPSVGVEEIRQEINKYLFPASEYEQDVLLEWDQAASKCSKAIAELITKPKD